jgi:protein tyrosine phosphatase (PTP) superfamily phosphohydrolase (DUF442 family)
MEDDVPDAPTPRHRRALCAVLKLGALVLAVVLTGNATILAASLWARTTTETTTLDIDGVAKGVVVDEHVWRGAAPTAEGYRELAEAGVSTIVDLRHDSERDRDAVAVIDDLGLDLVRLPIRDGQLPSAEEVAQFLDVVEHADGIVFVHCGAGVGRTGVMAAAYNLAVGDLTGSRAARRNLAVGPPSLEQIAFAALGERPPAVVTALSRILDAPRRIWHNL